MKPTITWDAAAASHLLSRTGFGGTPTQAERLAARPLSDIVAALVEEAKALAKMHGPMIIIAASGMAER